MQRRAREIFEQVIEITDVEKQGQLIDEACGGDSALRDAVNSLLAANRNVDGLLETHDRSQNSGDTNGPWDDPSFEQPGQIIAGRYKLRQNIGEGGMGSVWMAEQLEPVSRKVAIKMIKAGMDSKQVLARFNAERQALALMEHPNIAKVFDGGVTEQGRPFFVMEYVKGIPFTQYCDEARIPLNERLKLFIPVCQAIQHAHQKGVVHRDLKPSNILICLYDGEPVPKVIDFGLAKALHQPLTEQSIFTDHGMVLGTPLYMSPEQAELNNLDVDTRTDIYSLGVMLYELLTGSTPLEKDQFKKAAFDEVLRLIKEVEPPRPSTRLSGSTSLPGIAAQRNVDPKQLCKSLSGELDWIVMRALEKDRARRYDTASGLADDVKRYLSGDAVLARPASLAYRFRKFVGRNRTVVTAASLVVLSLVGGLIGTSWFAYQANIARLESDERTFEVTREKKKVELQKTRAETRERAAIDAVQRFGSVVSENPDLKNRPELESLRNELLESPINFFRSLREQLQEDSETTPESLDRLGQVGIELAELTEAIGDVEYALKTYDESAKIWTRLAEEDPTVAEYRNDLSSSFQRIANLLSDTGRSEEAMSVLLKSVETLDKLVEENPSVAKYQKNLAASHFDIGRLFSKTGQPEKAIASHTRAITTFKQLSVDHPDDVEFQHGVAVCQYGIAQVMLANGKSDEALIAYDESLQTYMAVTKKAPGNTEYQRALANCHLAVGGILTRPGTFDKAEEALNAAVTILEKLVDENPSVTDFQSDLAETYWSFGLLYLPTNRAEEALDAYRKSLEIREQLVDEHPTVSRFQAALSSSYFMYGMHLHYTSPEESLAYYQKSRNVKDKLIENNPAVTGYRRELAQLEINVGALFAQTGRPAKALAGFEAARDILKRIVDENPSDLGSFFKLASTYENLGIFYRESSEPAKSIESYQHALKIRKRLANENPSVAAHQDSLAKCHAGMEVTQQSMGKREEAITSNRKVIEILEAMIQKSPDDSQLSRRIADRYDSIGRALKNDKHYSEALVEFQKAADIVEEFLQKHPGDWGRGSQLGAILNNKALALIGLESFEKAKASLHKAIEWQKKAIANDPNSQRFRRFLDNHFKNLEKAARGLKDQQLLAATRKERISLAIEDPRYTQIESRLKAVLADAPASDPNELIQLALRAYSTWRYKAATRLYAKAFEEDPQLAEDRTQQHPYNAACSAALAALDLAGSGKENGQDDASGSNSEEGTEFHELASAWLNSELDRWEKFVEAHPDQVELVAKTMRHWQQDADLIGVREAEHLAGLPDAQRQTLEKLWTRVESFLSELEQQSP